MVAGALGAGRWAVAVTRDRKNDRRQPGQLATSKHEQDAGARGGAAAGAHGPRGVRHLVEGESRTSMHAAIWKLVLRQLLCVTECQATKPVLCPGCSVTPAWHFA